jgi:hypothetical protein
VLAAVLMSAVILIAPAVSAVPAVMSSWATFLALAYIRPARVGESGSPLGG